MTELERIEFDFMKAQLTAALSRIAAIESAPSSGGGGGDGGVARQPEYIDLDTDYPVKPFTIERDDTSSTDGNYKMYVPDGCVLYDGVAVSVSGKGSDDWLDLGTTEGVTYYLHVTESSGTKSASIDTSSSASGHLATVKVATIATDDESSQQFLFSAINISSGMSLDGISLDVDYDGNAELFGWCDTNADAEPKLAAMLADSADYGSIPYRSDPDDDLEYHYLGKIKAVSASGLSVSTPSDSSSTDYGNALIDISGRSASDTFGVHTITSGSDSAKFLGTSDITVSGGGGGTLTGNKTGSVAVSGALTVTGGFTTTGEEASIKVLTTDTTSGGVASGTIQIGAYYV